MALTAKTIVFSGFRNDELKTQIENLGGRVTSAVSGKTDMLVVMTSGKKGDSKTAKAKQLNVDIIEHDEFVKKYIKNTNASVASVASSSSSKKTKPVVKNTSTSKNTSQTKMFIHPSRKAEYFSLWDIFKKDFDDMPRDVPAAEKLLKTTLVHGDCVNFHANRFSGATFVVQDPVSGKRSFVSDDSDNGNDSWLSIPFQVTENLHNSLDHLQNALDEAAAYDQINNMRISKDDITITKLFKDKTKLWQTATFKLQAFRAFESEDYIYNDPNYDDDDDDERDIIHKKRDAIKRKQPREDIIPTFSVLLITNVYHGATYTRSFYYDSYLWQIDIEEVFDEIQNYRAPPPIQMATLNVILDMKLNDGTSKHTIVLDPKNSVLQKMLPSSKWTITTSKTSKANQFTFHGPEKELTLLKNNFAKQQK